MAFNGPITSTTPLYAELGILKFFDLVKTFNIPYYVHINTSMVIDL